MSVHSSPLRLAAFGSFRFTWSALFARTVVVDAVVVLAQHGQIRWLCMAAILVGIDVVDLAPVGRDVAGRPGANEILRHG